MFSYLVLVIIVIDIALEFFILISGTSLRFIHDYSNLFVCSAKEQTPP